VVPTIFFAPKAVSATGEVSQKERVYADMFGKLSLRHLGM
jgi:hypothetical protein